MAAITPHQDLVADGEDDFEALPRGNKGLRFRYDSFVYTHTILVVSEHSQESSLTKNTLLHWNHHSPDQFSSTAVDLPVESLMCVEGYKALGDFELPAPLAQQSDSSVNNLVSQLQERYRDPSALNMRAIAAVIGNEASGSYQCISFYAIDVSSSTAEILFAGDESIWTYAKPKSAYGFLQGWWEGTAEKAIVTGEWGAGKGFKLIVQGITRELKLRLLRSGSKLAMIRWEGIDALNKQ